MQVWLSKLDRLVAQWGAHQIPFHDAITCTIAQPNISTVVLSLAPTGATCASDPNNICGYVLDSNNQVVPGFYTACTYTSKKGGSYSSVCVSEAGMITLQTTGQLGSNEQFVSCGCCAGATDAFCGAPLDCAVQT